MERVNPYRSVGGAVQGIHVPTGRKAVQMSSEEA